MTNQSANIQLQAKVLRVLKSNFDGSQPIILLVAVYRETLNTTQIFVAMIMWSISDDEVGALG